MVKYSGMKVFIIHIIFAFIFVSCNEEQVQSGQVTISNPRGTYTHNPNVPDAGVVDFSGFSDIKLDLLYPTTFPSNDRYITLLVSDAIDEKFIYFYSDSICVTGSLGETEITSERFEFDLLLGDKYPDREFNIFYRLEDKNGIFSECLESELSYGLDTTPPVTPAAQLFSPNVPRSPDRNLEFEFSKMEIGATYSLFTNEDCVDLVHQLEPLSEAEKFNFNINSDDGLYNFYVRSIDQLGNTSDCHSIEITYTLDTTSPPKAGY